LAISQLSAAFEEITRLLQRDPQRQAAGERAAREHATAALAVAEQKLNDHNPISAEIPVYFSPNFRQLITGHGDVGAMPHFTNLEVKGTSVTLEWEAPIPVDEFEVAVQKAGPQGLAVENRDIVYKGALKRQLIPNLISDTKYSVYIRGRIQAGWTPTSTITFQTAKQTIKWGLGPSPGKWAVLPGYVEATFKDLHNGDSRDAFVESYLVQGGLECLVDMSINQAIAVREGYVLHSPSNYVVDVNYNGAQKYTKGQFIRLAWYRSRSIAWLLDRAVLAKLIEEVVQGEASVGERPSLYLQK